MKLKGKIYLVLILSFINGLFSILVSGHAGEKSERKIVLTLPSSIKGPIEYKDYLMDNPIRLIIEFTSQNVFADIIERKALAGQGIIKEVQLTHDITRKDKVRIVKSLTFYLVKQVPYRIYKEANKIIVEIDDSPNLPLITKSRDLLKNDSVFLKTPVQASLELRKEKKKERVEFTPLETKSKQEKDKMSLTGFTGSLEEKTVGTINNIDSLLEKPESIAYPGNIKPQKEETVEKEEILEPELGVESSVIQEAQAQEIIPQIGGLDKKAGRVNQVLEWLIGIVLLFIAAIVINLIWHIREVSLLQKKLEVQAQEELFSLRLVTQLYPKSPAAEAYRILRTNIQSIDPDRPIKGLLFTSALPGEGKTTTIANLAVAFAQMGNKVLLVDSALRQPLIDKVFALDRSPGLTEILTSGLIWTAAVNNTSIENLSIITSGRLPANPSEILGSTKMVQIIEEFKSRFDIVLFDSSDTLGVTDSAVLGSKLDGVFLVVQNRRTQRETVLKAQSLLEQARVRVLGYVLTYLNTAIPKVVNQYLEVLQPKL